MNDNVHDNSDIIDLKYPYIKKHPAMKMADRAAQFSPFAALKGYDSAIAEIEKQTVNKIEISEEKKDEINSKIKNLLLNDATLFSITYFVSDDKKEGGEYTTLKSTSLKYKEDESCLVIEDRKIPIIDIYDIRIYKD